MNFVNKSSQAVSISVDNKKFQCISSHETLLIDVKHNDILKIVLKQNKISYIDIINSCLKYCLLIETTYIIKNVCDSMSFDITREKIEFTYGTLYDRFFLNSSLECILSETHNVMGEKEIKKIYNRKKFKDILFLDPFLSNLSCIFWIPVISIILCILLGWKYLILILFLIWILMVFLNWIENKFVNTIFNIFFMQKIEKI